MISSILQVQQQEHIGHWAKTLVLGLGFYLIDFGSDVNLGLDYYNPINVTRYMGDSTVIPEYCVPHPDVNTTGIFECEEEHKNLGDLTFVIISLPWLAIVFEHGRVMVMYGWTHGFDVKKALLLFFYFLFVPFPIAVIVHHVSNLFIMNQFMENHNTNLLALGASFEDGPQLILQLCIMLSAKLQKKEREQATQFYWH